MRYHITFTEYAIETFQAIEDQLNNRWGKKTVKNFKHRVSKFIDLIEASPYIFAATGFDKTLRKGFIHKTCSVYYEVIDKDKQIIIHYFWDNRQDPII